MLSIDRKQEKLLRIKKDLSKSMEKLEEIPDSLLVLWMLSPLRRQMNILEFFMMLKVDSNLTESTLRRLDSNFAKLSISLLENPKFHLLLLMMEELSDSHIQTFARMTQSR
jgi:hypothetical protein